MRDSSRDRDERGNLERLGESAGAVAGRAADVGLEVTGALFRSAAELLGGWWSSDAPREAATAWNDMADSRFRAHYETSGNTSDTAAGATQATHAAPKSRRAAMQTAGEMSTDFSASGTGTERTLAADRATDGFAHARTGYQLGYVARRNPAYSGRSFSDVEPELQRVWESRAKAQGSDSRSWPEVRGFVDFAYQQED